MGISRPVKLWTLFALSAIVVALLVMESLHHRPWKVALLGVTLLGSGGFLAHLLAAGGWSRRSADDLAGAPAQRAALHR